MVPTFVQPDSSPINQALVRSILRSNQELSGETRAVAIENHPYHSNDLAEVTLSDNRSLIVKRGRYHWSHRRFRAARTAAGLIRTHTILHAPESLAAPAGDAALDAYWRLDFPTIADRWPRLDPEQRRAAMMSAGKALRSIHGIRLEGHGELHRAIGNPDPLADVLMNDLEGRLLPASISIWPQGAAIVRELAGVVPYVTWRAPSRGVLLHGDPHLGNLLCEREASVRCVGVLDLEDSAAGPAESDLARMAVLHTPLFQRPLEGDWLTDVLEGYGGGVDSLVFNFYCAYHTVNLGLHSASIGHDVHAADVAIAASRLTDRLRHPPGRASPEPALCIPVAE